MPKSRLLAVAVLGLLLTTPPVRSDAPPEFRELEPGLDYAQVVKDRGPLAAHVLRVRRDRRGWEWTTAHGEGRILGLSPLTKIVRTTAGWLGARPVAAINGDWFEIAPGNYQGDPRGLQVIEGEVVSAPAPHTCFWVDAGGRLEMGIVESRFRVVWPAGAAETPLGLNEYRPDDKAVLYTPALGHHPSDAGVPIESTRTVDGREFSLEPAEEGAWIPFRVGRAYRARVATVRETGNSPLRRRSVILSLGPGLTGRVPGVKVGDTLTLRLETSPDLSGARNALGGGVRLVRAGKVEPLEGDVRGREPRSMLGWNRDRTFLAVVDGRQPKLSAGMTYRELAAFAAELGCDEAMALDGGGSATLWGDGRILNSPCDGEPRSVANALILIERKK
jgi:hypothetical protein